ncbi:ATP-binding protein [Azotobacter chroococcum]|uniref:Phage DNA replication protein (Predicted replicative helicase loader) n=1 Tax=Azotobacter chroococcum TaxID=353 RepID=A0A4R1P875_9GAMM|nr:ATP-binding protein [Azotobacter chroococcum]TBV95285.1 ATP-binding protein [Azotobacter chroococcum]TCL22088.1 phage DNA replication protein (predicted replicative helicase loader) [Azotobacter chroococcum]
MRISNFGAAPRTKTRADRCPVHGEFDRTLVEAFEGDNRVIGCPRCRFDAIHGQDGAERTEAVESKRWEIRNAALFATGIAPRFRRCSLENYRASLEGQKLALDTCRAYVDQFEENFAAGRCLLLMGNFGTGKTHLGCSILKAVVTRHCASALYVPAADIIAALKASFGRDAASSEREIFAELAGVDLLLIDELGAQGGTEFERQSLHQIIDTRYRNMLPTIITSNLPSTELAAYIGDRALDRLRENGGQAVVFDWDSARGGDQ